MKRVMLGWMLIVTACFAFAPPVAQVQTQSAQSVPPQSAQQQPPTFQTRTITIEVDAIVRDKSGKFVSGLKPTDFEVFEGGVAQTIHSMYVVEGRAAMPVLMRPNQGAAKTQAADASETAEARNASIAPTAAPQRIFVLFFDQDHMEANGFKRLKDAAEKFLTTEFHVGDLGGVIVGATMVGNRLSDNRETLVQAVRTAKFSSAQRSRKLNQFEWPRMTETEASRIDLARDDAVLLQVVRRASADLPGVRDPEQSVRQKAREIVIGLRLAAAQTMRTLVELVTGLERLPGRKTVIFLTDGFYVEESWGQLRTIVATAARSNVRLYAVDAQGLQRRSDVTDLAQMNPMETAAHIPTEQYNTVEEGPNTLAMDTGGYVVRHTNDFVAALKEIALDTSSYYVLGYTPTNAQLDGKFRSIRVRVKVDGVSVRARNGYVAAAK